MHWRHRAVKTIVLYVLVWLAIFWQLLLHVILLKNLTPSGGALPFLRWHDVICIRSIQMCANSKWPENQGQTVSWEFILILEDCYPIDCINFNNIAVYTCIKKPKSFSHSGFSLKVARQLPLNTPKKTESKNPPPQRDFFETPLKFHWFFANVNARSNLAGIIRVFGHVVRDLQRNHPTAARDVMRTTRVRSKVERSRACAPLTKTQDLRFGFFRACAFRAKNPECYGFFWQCKRYNKKTQVFWILVFANVNGPYLYEVLPSLSLPSGRPCLHCCIWPDLQSPWHHQSGSRPQCQGSQRLPDQSGGQCWLYWFPESQKWGEKWKNSYSKFKNILKITVSVKGFSNGRVCAYKFLFFSFHWDNKRITLANQSFHNDS